MKASGASIAAAVLDRSWRRQLAHPGPGRRRCRPSRPAASVAQNRAPAPQPARQPALRIGVARPGGYTVRAIPVDEYVAGVLAGEAARESAPSALEALAITVRTYAVANLEPAPRRRLRPVRPDALPGAADGDAGNRAGGGGDDRQSALVSRRAGVGVLQRVVRRPHRAAVGSLARRQGPRIPPFSRRRCVRRDAGLDRRAVLARLDPGVARGGVHRQGASRCPHPRPQRVRTGDRAASGGILAGPHLRPGPARGCRPHAWLAAHQEHGVRPQPNRRRLSIFGTWLRARRRPLRDRLRPSRRPRTDRRLRSSPATSRARRLRRCPRRSSPPSNRRRARRGWRGRKRRAPAGRRVRRSPRRRERRRRQRRRPRSPT